MLFNNEFSAWRNVLDVVRRWPNISGWSMTEHLINENNFYISRVIASAQWGFNAPFMYGAGNSVFHGFFLLVQETASLDESRGVPPMNLTG